ncbi:MAG: hypothetical protein K0R44_41 [Thermomicrobiales bacterium]|jgi:hypothetical protein|nr:hypothetical protein [Thermomicrobiales bacterium]MDF3014816.1 hypothetical protein [Thermomicrobiales bacterium]
MPRTPAAIDFGDEFAVDDTPVDTVLVKGVFGEDFHVVRDVNLWSLMMVADEDPKLSDLVRLTTSLIRDDEQVRFRTLIARQRNLNAEKLNALISRLVEVASEGHPTKSSSGSSRTTRAKGALPASAGS